MTGGGGEMDECARPSCRNYVPDGHAILAQASTDLCVEQVVVQRIYLLWMENELRRGSADPEFKELEFKGTYPGSCCNRV